MHKIRDKAKTQAVKEFFGGATEIARDDFLKKFIENTILTSPYTIRVFATDVLKNTPPAETFKNYQNAFANLLGPTLTKPTSPAKPTEETKEMDN